MDFKSASKNLILALASSSFALTAVAQWQWIDMDGHRVFSDRAPPTDIPAKNILKQPHRGNAAAQATGAASDAAPGQAPTASTPAKPPSKETKETELEAKKKQAEAQEAAKKKTEEESLAKTKAENCERSKNGLATLQTGVKIITTNANGEREVMDDAARTVETKRLEGIIQSECKK